MTDNMYMMRCYEDPLVKISKWDKRAANESLVILAVILPNSFYTMYSMVY